MAKNITVEKLDPFECKIRQGGVKALRPCLSYEYEHWSQAQFGYKNKIKRQNLILKGGLFLTGWLPRVQEFCEKKGINLTVVDNTKGIITLPKSEKPKLEGITFRNDQLYALEQIRQNHRGIIKFPTASGKSIIACGIISMYPKAKALVLAHTKTIISQLREDIDKFGLTDRAEVTTVQSYRNKEVEDKYDIIIVDETHHAGNRNGMYANVLRQTLAPIRVGLTATAPNNQGNRLIMEGLFGPIIAELSIQEASSMGILAKPKIILKKIPYNSRIKQLRKYSDAYYYGIINNRARNRQVILDTKEALANGETVLILITNIEHGDNLVDMANRIYGLDLVFVQGKTEADLRTQVRHNLESKDTKCAIATAVFKEGFNVKSLDVVINAGGGKSELGTLQIIGRGLRKTDEKEEVKIIDYFDPSNRYLIDHFGHRLTLYFDNGWL